METCLFTDPRATGTDDVILSEVIFKNPLEENGSGGDLLVKVINGDLRGCWYILEGLEGVPISEFEDDFWELVKKIFPDCDSLERSPKVNVKEVHERFNKFSLSLREIVPLSLLEKEELVKKFFGDYSPERELDELVSKIKMVVQDVSICFPEIKELNYSICQGLKEILNEIDDIDLFDDVPEGESLESIRWSKEVSQKCLYSNEIIRGEI